MNEKGLVTILAGMAVILLGSIAQLNAATPVLTATGECGIINATTLACKDGYPITVGFSVTNNYQQYYGSFIISPRDTANVSQAVDQFGNQCEVGSGSTVICSVTLRAFPLTTYNATVKKSIKLVWTSSLYPQYHINDSLNVTIFHYLDQNESMFMKVYAVDNKVYTEESSSYEYFCKVYGICNTQLGYGIGLAGTYLQFAINNANRSATAAFYNLSIANNTLNAGSSQYASFINSSNKILSNWLAARYLLANITNVYNSNRNQLASCKNGGTSYAASLSKAINSSLASPMQTSLASSASYMAGVYNLSSYENNAIQKCGGTGYSGSGGFLSTLGKNFYYIIIGVIVIIVAAYLLLRFRSAREVRMIREAAEEKSEEQRHGDQPEEEAGVKE